MNGYFSITEFAKLCNISRDTLLYYDKIGLLLPSFKAQNNYRYYSYKQYENYKIIEELKQLGLSINSIKEHIDKKSPRNLYKIIATTETDLDLQIKRLNNLKIVLATEKQELKDAIDNLNTFKIMNLKTTKILKLEKRLNDVDSFNSSFVELDNIIRNNDILTYYPLGTYGKINRDFIEQEKMTYKDFVVFEGIYSIILDEYATSQIRKGGKYLVTYVYNNFDDEITIFKEAIEYAALNNIEIEDDFYNESIGGVFNTDDNPMYLSKYMFPIKLKS